jgi:hypothetical protein
MIEIVAQQKFYGSRLAFWQVGMHYVYMKCRLSDHRSARSDLLESVGYKTRYLRLT